MTVIKYTIIIMLLSFQVNASYKELCQSFKPNGTFDGIKVYNKYYVKNNSMERDHEFRHFMYRNGSEWQFFYRYDPLFDHGSIHFYVDTLRKMRKDKRKLYHRFQFKNTEYDIIQLNDQVALSKNRSHYLFSSISHQDNFTSNKVLILNPNYPLDSLILDKDNSSLKEFNYYEPTGSISYIKEFISDMPAHLLVNLEGIVENYPNSNYSLYGWLLFFKIGSKPMFCYTNRTDTYPKQCQFENLQEYGMECDVYMEKLNEPVKEKPKKIGLTKFGPSQKSLILIGLAILISLIIICALFFYAKYIDKKKVKV